MNLIEWILELRSESLKPEMQVIEKVSYMRKKERELFYIAEFANSGATLLNHVGNDGMRSRRSNGT